MSNMAEPSNSGPTFLSPSAAAYHLTERLIPALGRGAVDCAGGDNCRADALREALREEDVVDGLGSSLQSKRIKNVIWLLQLADDGVMA